MDPKLATPIGDQIDKNAMDCLNEHTANPLANALQPNEDLFLSSDPDVDEQLIIRFQFLQPVNLSGICLKGPDDGTAPKSVKIFTNKLSLGFEDASDAVPIESVELTEEQAVGGQPIPVRFVKFQNIKSLQIFVSENNGGDVTKVSRLELFGTLAQKMNMAEFKPVKG